MTTGRADVLGSTAVAGEVRINLGSLETGAGIANTASMWLPWGFYSRPAPPTDGVAARAWWSHEGNQKRIVGFEDARIADEAKVGAIADGDVMLVTLGEARVMLKAADDTVTLYTVSQPDDKSMMVSLSGRTGKLLLQVAGAFVEVKEGKITLSVNGGGSIIIDGNGVRVTGATFDANTAGGRLGKVSCSTPVPNPALGIDAVAGPAAVPSATWFRDP